MRSAIIKILALLFFMLTYLAIPAQHKRRSDSLYSLINDKKSHDTTVILARYELAWEYSNPDSFNYHIKKAREFTERFLKNYKTETTAYITIELVKARICYGIGWDNFLHGRNKEAREFQDTSIAICTNYLNHPDAACAKKAKLICGMSLLAMGPTYSVEGNYSRSIGFYLQALPLFTEIGDESNIGKTYTNLGIDFQLQGMYPKAIEYYFKALQISEKKGAPGDIAYALVNLANVYKKQKNYKQALAYYFKVLDINKSLGDNRLEANAYGSIGSVYNSLNDYSKAIDYNFRALRLHVKMGDKRGEVIIGNGIGLIYESKKQYDSALVYFMQALKISEERKYHEGAAVNCANIGKVYTSQKKFGEAETYLKKGLDYARESSIGASQELHQNLAKLYDITKQPALAYEHYKKFITFRDSINNKENTKAQTQTEMNYEFDKKQALAKLEQDKKDALSLEEKRKQQIIIIAVSTGLLLMVVLAAVVFRSLRTNQKNNRIIQQQKEAVEGQKLIVEQKHKEITDSINYAERIQRSFLASQELLREGLNDYFVLFMPKDVVSGDFYWAAHLNNGSFAYITADSTGHGVPGAIMSILNISSLEKAVETQHEPASILNTTRINIIERLKKDGSSEGGKDGMDCNLVVVDKQRKRLTYAAANNPLWIVRSQTLLEFKADKMPVGKSDKDAMPFSQQNIELQPNDMVYTFTDGMPDQFGGEKGKKYMHKRLKEFLISIAASPLNDQKQRLIREFESWKQDHEQVDDVCVIGFRVG